MSTLPTPGKISADAHAGNEDLIIVNPARSPSEMQISPCY